MDIVRSMLAFVEEIPVTFGPHWADRWLVYTTIASVVVSLFLAYLALRNGQLARATAEEQRDDADAQKRNESASRNRAAALAVISFATEERQARWLSDAQASHERRNHGFHSREEDSLYVGESGAVEELLVATVAPYLEATGQIRDLVGDLRDVSRWGTFADYPPHIARLISIFAERALQVFEADGANVEWDNTFPEEVERQATHGLWPVLKCSSAGCSLLLAD